MKWEYWLKQFLETHCTARGLRSNTIAAYRDTLICFWGFIRVHCKDKEPDELKAVHILDYVNYLRQVRDNGPSAINRQVTVIKNFYRAMVAMELLSFECNPMACFPRIKAAPRKLPTWLSQEEMEKLMRHPRTDTVMGVRDRALIITLYGTGIRASECAGLCECDIDFGNKTIQVTGKGGHQRVIPLNPEVIAALQDYRQARGPLSPDQGFFQSRNGNAMTRNGIYERIRSHGRKSGIEKRLSPHRLRHTFATHLVKEGVDLLTISKLLGHRNMSSTQIYLHLTVEDLRDAADRHPVSRLIEKLEDFLPNLTLPFQYPLAERKRKEI
jgi:site-specific recombinase XerD